MPSGIESLAVRNSLSREIHVPDEVAGHALKAPFERSIGRGIRIKHCPFAGKQGVGFRTLSGECRDSADIAVLGDSHVYGLESGEGGHWLSRLERSSGLSVADLGVSNIGTTQALELYRNFGRDFHPKVVLLMVCPNDAWDNAVFLRWKDERGAGGWTDFKKYKSCRRLGVSSAAACGLVRSLWRGGGAFGLGITLVRIALRKIHGRRGWGHEDLDSILRDVDELGGLVRGEGGRLAVLVNESWRFSSPRTQAALQEGLGKRGIPVLDLNPRLRSPRLHIPLDGHWNEAGHEAAAEAVYDFLRKAGLAGATASRKPRAS